MRAAGGVVGYIGGCDEGASWAWRSLSSPTCHDEEVADGCGKERSGKKAKLGPTPARFERYAANEVHG